MVEEQSKGEMKNNGGDVNGLYGKFERMGKKGMGYPLEGSRHWLFCLLRHSGLWISESDYANYRIDGILLKEYATYNDLVDGISTQLEIDCSHKRMEIRYMMKGNVTPMDI
ncbi:hypothetical protein H5410_042900 [Solanum commersonii]|uniref:Uncharacterized protein n=1 Tax=Solanum commersonii TaxID=4109 RepID=A0A9J5XXC3_SOLCO|nr:hypothetical protein H5410_042900 [Solanum commersonii]